MSSVQEWSISYAQWYWLRHDQLTSCLLEVVSFLEPTHVKFGSLGVVNERARVRPYDTARLALNLERSLHGS